MNAKQSSDHDKIVLLDAAAILVGGGPLNQDVLVQYVNKGFDCVAADGGADQLRELGVRPRAVFGDMDSLSADAKAELAPQIRPICEQDSTDFDKALRHVVAPLVLAFGVSGGRFDHALAGLHVLLRYPERPCIIVGSEDICFLCPPSLNVPLPQGTRVSLFPMARCRVASSGLRWATDHLEFDPTTQIGTSNAALGGLVTLAADAPAMMVILPLHALPVVSDAFIALDGAARWSARDE